VYRVLPAIPLVLVVVFVIASSQASGREGSNFREAVRSDRGVVASESPDASRIGLEVLDYGGNAVDAAVAATFALGVARPQSCGIGGGGFMVYRGADGEAAALDFREASTPPTRGTRPWECREPWRGCRRHSTPTVTSPSLR
jgi:gamma-glutamyltranspeptidase/glutathione hydrolase